MGRQEQIDKLKKLAAEQNLLADESEVAEILNSQRLKIKLPGDDRELSQFAAELGEECAKHGLYRRDRMPVVINTGEKRLEPVTAEMLRTWAEYHVVCYKEKQINDDITIKIYRTMNLDTARGTLEAEQFLNKLPAIKRINETRLPVIRADGRVELLPVGYFAEQEILTFDDGMTLNEEMGADEARQKLDELLRFFPFASPRSKAVAIAAMLTMFCRSMLPRHSLRPCFVYTANAQGAGKTLLAMIAVIPVVGIAATRTLPRREEQKKVLDIFAMQASSYIFFDNIKTQIGGEDLEQFITSPILKGRILGESREFVVDNVATMFLTGNQSKTSQDMAERSLAVELRVREADNRSRVIPKPIDPAWLAAPENRARILSALWALVRAWAANGKPEPKTRLQRFEKWSEIVAAIVSNAGYGDPCALAEANLNPELRDMHSLVAALAPRESETNKISDTEADPREWKFPEIIDQVTKLGLFDEVEIQKGRTREDMFSEDEVTPAGKSFFGKLLTQYHDRYFIVEGRTLRFVVKGRGNTRAYLVLVIRPEDNQPF